MIKPIWQNAIHAGILALVAVGCFSLAPKAPDVPHGILLPTGNLQSKPISAANVSLYDNFPTGYQVVGQIRTAMYAGNYSHDALQADAEQSVQYAQLLAGNAGANGIVVSVLQPTGQGPTGGAVILYGTAIRTN